MHEPTLVALTDMAPVPRVQIVFSSMPAGTVTATVFRLAAGLTFRVRGAIRVAAAGGFALIDSEAPFGMVVTYRAEAYDAAGLSLGFTDPADVVVDFNGTVIHLPLDPYKAAVVDPADGWASSIARPSDVDVRRPMGRNVAVAISFGRGGVTDVPLLFYTDDPAAAALVDAISQDTLPIVCVRTATPLGLPQPLFAVADFRRLMVDEQLGGSTVLWQGSATQVAPPAEMILTAILTYADLEAAYDTYADLEAAYLTYLDMESDFSLAGTA